MDRILDEAYRYNKWANLHLLDVCAKLGDGQLELTAPGTYGTIASTWLHLLAAEQRYIKRLGGSEPRIGDKKGFPGIAELKREAERSGDELMEVAARVTSDSTVEVDGDDGRYRLSQWVVALQAIHHGNDHRTHLCTILGHNGIDYGEMDVWRYGDAIGDTILVQAKG
jgi:uncharacterized damage-inducible protein DinB